MKLKMIMWIMVLMFPTSLVFSAITTNPAIQHSVGQGSGANYTNENLTLNSEVDTTRNYTYTYSYNAIATSPKIGIGIAKGQSTNYETTPNDDNEKHEPEQCVLQTEDGTIYGTDCSFTFETTQDSILRGVGYTSYDLFETYVLPERTTTTDGDDDTSSGGGGGGGSSDDTDDTDDTTDDTADDTTDDGTVTGECDISISPSSVTLTEDNLKEQILLINGESNTLSLNYELIYSNGDEYLINQIDIFGEPNNAIPLTSYTFDIQFNERYIINGEADGKLIIYSDDCSNNFEIYVYVDIQNSSTLLGKLKKSMELIDLTSTIQNPLYKVNQTDSDNVQKLKWWQEILSFFSTALGISITLSVITGLFFIPKGVTYLWFPESTTKEVMARIFWWMVTSILLFMGVYLIFKFLL